MSTNRVAIHKGKTYAVTLAAILATLTNCGPQSNSNALSIAGIEISSVQLADAFKELENAAKDEILSQKFLDTPTKIDFNDMLKQVGDQPIKLGGYTFINPRANLLRYQNEIKAAAKTPSTLRADLSIGGYNSLRQLNQNELRRNLALTEKIFNGTFQGSTYLTEDSQSLELVGKKCGIGIGLSVAKGIATVLACVFAPPACAPAIAGTAAGAAFTAAECESEKQHAKSESKKADAAKKDEAERNKQDTDANPADGGKKADENTATTESSGS